MLLRIGTMMSSSVATGEGGGTPGFSPVSLSPFAMYDPLASGGLWQDTAATTPATLSDPVGRVNDVSGNAANATQSTGANRPTLQDTANIRSLKFDGSNDALNATLTTTLPLDIYIAWYDTLATTARHLQFRDGTTNAIFSSNAGGTTTAHFAGVNAAMHVAPSSWSVIRYRLTSVAVSIQPNGGRVVSAATTGAAPSVLRIGNGIDVLFPSSAALGPIVVCPQLSVDDQALLMGWYRTRLGMVGAYAAEGDSLTAWSATSGFSYSDKLVPNLPNPVGYSNFAVASSALSHLNARAASVDAMLSFYEPDTAILSVLTANDLVSGSVATYLSTLATYLDARRTAGWKVVLGTILPRTTAGFNDKRNEANDTLATWVGTHCDALADFAADADIGVDAAASDTDWYYDGTHPTTAGQAIMEPIMRAAVETVLAA